MKNQTDVRGSVVRNLQKTPLALGFCSITIFTKTISELSCELASWLDSPLPRLLIGLAGLPGSGKSTLARQLEETVNAKHGPNAVIALGMDGFHLTRAQLHALPDPASALARRGAPWTFDPAGMSARLEQIRTAVSVEPIPWPGFEHGVGDPVQNATSVSPLVRLVLVEGLYLCHTHDGWEAVRQKFDSVWYLDTPFELAMNRLAQRHMASWGMTREEADQRIGLNDRHNAEIVLASRSNADRIVTVHGA